MRKVVLGVLFAFLFIMAAFVTRDMSSLAITAIVIAFGALVVLNRRLEKKEQRDFRLIMTHLCDPQKLADVYRCYVSQRKGKPTNPMRLMIAEADFYAGHYKEAHSVLHELMMEKWPLEFELMYDQIFGYYSYMKGHKKEWEDIQKDFAYIYRDREARGFAGKQIESIYSSFLSLIHLEKHEYEEAKKVLEERIASQEEEPFMKAFDSYWLAQAYIESGDNETARKHLEYVRDHGNTMGVKKEAEKLLGSLGNRPALKK